MIVSDPMCSWCWGMAPEIDRARAQLARLADFGLLLGGINLGAQSPVDAAMLPRFQRLWADVTAVTGQVFCGRFPDGDFVYNSRSACRAVAAFREVTGTDGLDYLAALQRTFFDAARDVGRREVQLEQAALLGAPIPAFRTALDDARLWAQLEVEFERAHSFGTHALPSTLLERQGGCVLVAGGYIDAPMLVAEIEQRLG